MRATEASIRNTKIFSIISMLFYWGLQRHLKMILIKTPIRFSMFPAAAFATGTTSGFSDMPSDWSTTALQNAVQMKTFVGSGDRLNPGSNITREEAFVVLARAFKLSGAPASALNKFSDKALISSWAKDAAASLIAAGYIVGANSQLKPKQNITRAEFAQIMDNLLKNYLKTAGTYTTDFTGNVMINVAGVTLKDLKITGDLIIGDGVGNGDIILDGVTVTGRTIIRGGGVNSIKIIGNSNLQNIVIARVDGQVRVYTEDGTQIAQNELNYRGLTDVTIQDVLKDVYDTSFVIAMRGAHMEEEFKQLELGVKRVKSHIFLI